MPCPLNHLGLCPLWVYCRFNSVWALYQTSHPYITRSFSLNFFLFLPLCLPKYNIMEFFKKGLKNILFLHTCSNCCFQLLRLAGKIWMRRAQAWITKVPRVHALIDLNKFNLILILRPYSAQCSSLKAWPCWVVLPFPAEVESWEIFRHWTQAINRAVYGWTGSASLIDL